MNSHQRRKRRRRLGRPTGSQTPFQFIRDWKDLATVPDSATHRLEIDVDGCNGEIHRKDGQEYMPQYLSTHTFYGSNYLRSTRRLRACGFNITLANWDADSPDPYQSQDYQRFVAEAAKNCTCHRDVCDSVLAGGICDNVQQTDEYDDD